MGLGAPGAGMNRGLSIGARETSWSPCVSHQGAAPHCLHGPTSYLTHTWARLWINSLQRTQRHASRVWSSASDTGRLDADEAVPRVKDIAKKRRAKNGIWTT